MSHVVEDRLNGTYQSLLDKARGGPSPPGDGEGGKPTHTGIVDRLTRRYGAGTKPHARRAFFVKLQRAVDTHGAAAYDIISSVVQSSDSAGSNAVLWFCKSVKLRLAEAGLWQKVTPVEW